MVEETVKRVKKQTVERVCDDFAIGEELYVKEKAENHGRILVYLIKTNKKGKPDFKNIEVKKVDPKTKKTIKKNKLVLQTSTSESVVTGYRLIYQGVQEVYHQHKVRKRIVLKLLGGSPGFQRKTVHVGLADKKYLAREKPKPGCGEAPDRQPIHIIYTITEEEEVPSAGGKKSVNQKGYLQVGLKTKNPKDFKSFPGLNNIQIVTDSDPLTEKDQVYIHIPTVHNEGASHNKKTEFGWIWFKIFEFPTNYDKTDPGGKKDMKNKDPYSRFLHVGRGSAGCITVKVQGSTKKDSGQYDIWDKMFRKIAFARMPGRVRVLTKKGARPQDKQSVYSIGTMSIVKKLKKKPKPKKKKP